MNFKLGALYALLALIASAEAFVSGTVGMKHSIMFLLVEDLVAYQLELGLRKLVTRWLSWRLYLLRGL